MSSHIYRSLNKVPGIHYFHIVNFGDNYTYVVNPKVMSTAVIEAINIDFFQEIPSRNSSGIVEYITRRELIELSKNRKLVSIVRDPVERLVSCYVQKIVMPDSVFRPFGNYFFQYWPVIKPKMTFPEFADAVCTIPDKFSEKHFMSQKRVLGFDANVSFDCIVSIQNYSLLSKILPSLGTIEKNVSDKNHMVQCDGLLREKILDRYHSDFEFFGDLLTK